MTSRHRSVAARIAVAGLLPLACSAAFATPASAAAQPINYQCEARASGQATHLTFRIDVDGSAPATAKRGGPVRVLITPARRQLPASVAGHRINDVRDLTFTVPVPGNAEYVSATLDGGSGLGSKATVTRKGGNVTVTVPGPIRGGTEFQLPRLTLNLRALRAGVVETRLGGNSYANAGLAFGANVQMASSVLRVGIAYRPRNR